MAKAETFGKPATRKDGTSASLRDYTSLLGVVAAGILGMSLLCITSAIALSNPDPSNPIVLEPASIVDMAISNLNTVAALTVQAAIRIEPTSTVFLTNTPFPAASPTLTSSAHPTVIRITSTATRRPRPTSSPTHVPPTNTPKPPPTNTPIPPPTNTPTPYPTDTDTPIPPYPTDTPDTPPAVTPVDTATEVPTQPPTAPSIVEPTATAGP